MFCHSADALGHPGIPLKVRTLKSAGGVRKNGLSCWVCTGLLLRLIKRMNTARGDGGTAQNGSLLFLGWILASVNSLIRVFPNCICLKALTLKQKTVEN